MDWNRSLRFSNTSDGKTTNKKRKVRERIQISWMYTLTKTAAVIRAANTVVVAVSITPIAWDVLATRCLVFAEGTSSCQQTPLYGRAISVMSTDPKISAVYWKFSLRNTAWARDTPLVGWSGFPTFFLVVCLCVFFIFCHYWLPCANVYYYGNKLLWISNDEITGMGY